MTPDSLVKSHLYDPVTAIAKTPAVLFKMVAGSIGAVTDIHDHRRAPDAAENDEHDQKNSHWKWV
jgi:hypothetical protein